MFSTRAYARVENKMRGGFLFIFLVLASCQDTFPQFRTLEWSDLKIDNRVVHPHSLESVTVSSEEGNIHLNAKDDIILKFKNTPHSSVKDFSISLRNLVSEHQQMKRQLLKLIRKMKQQK